MDGIFDKGPQNLRIVNLWKYVSIWFFLIRFLKILTLDNLEFYFFYFLVILLLLSSWREKHGKNGFQWINGVDSSGHPASFRAQEEVQCQESLTVDWAEDFSLKFLGVTNYGPRKRSEFNQLQLELGKLKATSADDKQSETDVNKTIEQPASVKARTHELVHGLHNAISKYEFYHMIR